MLQWNAAKAKVQLRISVQRLRILQEKKEAQAKATRRDIATLLERGKVETARVKVETIINEDIHVELLELLELYCELLLARFGLLDQNTREPNPGIIEGVCSIIHAAPRTELKELHVLRDILMHKFGREFSISVMENQNGCVSERIVRKLSVATPPRELVDAYLVEIAKAYRVDWSPAIPRTEGENSQGEPQDIPTKSEEVPVPVIQPGKSSESVETSGTKPNVPPTEDETSNPVSKVMGTSAKGGASPEPKDEDDFEALTKRFAALKKR
ncbi:DUF292-domain-containing protein [Infundibulicybe gibba]|nr:DUF292-domain-containing protein [Infundibulicybe gibba]